ncbi:head GIN domain-containing protein [Euzebyella saccharophila]|uniref:Head GIN domain-containing protein n=1 Tax=Euzebyella saccharophila TaxID=679664 RepID=A0ABV8JRJ0_9FLAO|nr:head GIN domain-containing protein [Euzebyella saccharophila]
MNTKNIVTAFLILVLSGTLAFGQKTTIDLDNFMELKVFDRINVTLVKSTENKAIITGDDADDVKISNDDGLLKIRMEVKDFLDGNETNVELHYKEELALIDANEGAKVISQSELANRYISIRSQEGGQVKASINTRNLDVKAITGGKIWLSGAAPNQEASIRSGGEYHAKDLASNQTEVTVFAGGKAFVNSKEYVEANVTAGGSIEIFGNPEQIEQDKTFGGSIVVNN